MTSHLYTRACAHARAANNHRRIQPLVAHFHLSRAPENPTELIDSMATHEPDHVPAPVPAADSTPALPIPVEWVTRNDWLKMTEKERIACDIATCTDAHLADLRARLDAFLRNPGTAFELDEIKRHLCCVAAGLHYTFPRHPDEILLYKRLGAEWDTLQREARAAKPAATP